MNVSDIDFHFLSVAELLLSFKRKDTGISSKKQQGKQSNSNHLGIFYLLLVDNILLCFDTTVEYRLYVYELF